MEDLQAVVETEQKSTINLTAFRFITSIGVSNKEAIRVPKLALTILCVFFSISGEMQKQTSTRRRNLPKEWPFYI